MIETTARRKRLGKTRRNLSVHLSVCLPHHVSLSICPSGCLSCLYIYLSHWLSVLSLHLHLSVPLAVCPVHTSTSICPSGCLSCPYIYIYLFLWVSVLSIHLHLSVPLAAVCLTVCRRSTVCLSIGVSDCLSSDKPVCLTRSVCLMVCP